MIPVLVLVFAVAAGLKVARPAATAREFAALGLPRPDLLARLVPAVEATVAVALVLAAPWGAAAALVLLVCFTVLLVDVVRSGRVVSCGCLGAVQSRPVSWATVARNLALMVVAVVALVVPALRWPTPTAPVVVALALIAVPVALILAVGGQLLALRQTLGRLWSVQLAGDAGPSTPAVVPVAPARGVRRNPNPPPGTRKGRNH